VAFVTHLNVEIKARCHDPNGTVRRLLTLGARLEGVDAQTDVYYECRSDRLKLRRGAIENSLIGYHRPDESGASPSRVELVELPPDRAIDRVLAAALGRDVVVDKRRHILWIANVKFHVDDVAGLGTFVEIEAIDRDGGLGETRLREQCERYRRLLGIEEADLEARSYSDLLRGR